MCRQQCHVSAAVPCVGSSAMCRQQCHMCRLQPRASAAASGVGCSLVCRLLPRVSAAASCVGCCLGFRLQPRVSAAASGVGCSLVCRLLPRVSAAASCVGCCLGCWLWPLVIPMASSQRDGFGDNKQLNNYIIYIFFYCSHLYRRYFYVTEIIIYIPHCYTISYLDMTFVPFHAGVRVIVAKSLSSDPIKVSEYCDLWG